MSEYAPPIEDIASVLEEVTSLERLAKLPEFVHADPESVRGALEECGRFVREVIAPLNAVGDRQHSRRNDDRVGQNARRPRRRIPAVHRVGVGQCAAPD